MSPKRDSIGNKPYSPNTNPPPPILNTSQQYVIRPSMVYYKKLGINNIRWGGGLNINYRERMKSESWTEPHDPSDVCRIL